MLLDCGLDSVGGVFCPKSLPTIGLSISPTSVGSGLKDRLLVTIMVCLFCGICRLYLWQENAQQPQLGGASGRRRVHIGLPTTPSWWSGSQ